ncbi:MAG TPA: hypothetical protein VGD81_08835 [Opitutaceae bacterium]
MNWLRAVCVLAVSVVVQAAYAYAPSAGALPIASLTAEWHDATRERDVPVKIYYPTGAAADAVYPVIVFSHGLGGARETYRYLGEYWAAHGYVSVHVQHAGSDDAVWRDERRPARALARAAADPSNFINRPRDVSFALDRLTALNADPSFALHGRLDLDRVGAAGHSFGAYTTMALAGQQFQRGGSIMGQLADPRIKAAIAMSTPTRKSAGGAEGSVYAEISIPVYHLTGTEDSDPMGTSDPALRRVPYDQMRKADAYLLILSGGDHMVFSGQRRRGDGTHDAEFHRLIQESTTAFWDAWLKNDAAAKAWLEGEGFAAARGEAGTFEQKHPLSEG